MNQLFIVAAGKHYEQDGCLYNRGDFVVSGNPLDTMFRNKFLKVELPQDLLVEFSQNDVNWLRVSADWLEEHYQQEAADLFRKRADRIG